MRLCGVLLAAGASRRYGADKLTVPLAGGEAVAVCAARSLLAGLPAALAVIRPGDATLGEMLGGLGLQVVECARAGRGMGASLACGVAAASDADGWVVALADMPWVAPATVRALAAALAGGAAVAAPFHDGCRGLPVGFSRAHRDALLALDGDRGARAIVAAAGDALWRVDVDDPGVLRDVDAPGDLGEAPRRAGGARSPDRGF